MKNTDLYRSADARGVELLENRQLFAGFTPHGPGFFPNLTPAAHYVEIDRGVALDISWANIRFLIGNMPQSSTAAATTPVSSDTDTSSSPIASAAADTSHSATGTVTETAARTPAADAAAIAAEPLPTSVAAIALGAASDGQLNGVNITPGPLKHSGQPTAPVVISADLPKVFADRPATAAALMQAPAPANGTLASALPSYLKAPAANEVAAYQMPAQHTHPVAVATDADQPVVVAGVKLDKAPQRATLAVVPTGNLLSQPLWQRIAAASATVVLLAVNWMLRRKRDAARGVERTA